MGVINKANIPVTVLLGDPMKNKLIDKVPANQIVLKKFEMSKDEKYRVYDQSGTLFASLIPKHDEFMLLIEKNINNPETIGRIAELEVIKE